MSAGAPLTENINLQDLCYLKLNAVKSLFRYGILPQLWSAFYQWLMKLSNAGHSHAGKTLAINIHDRSSLKAGQAPPGPAV